MAGSTVERLPLARVTRLPEWHPEAATFEPFPVHGWVVRHPEGVIVVDTGIGRGHPAIEEWYGPEVVAIEDALRSVGVNAGDVMAVVLSHLHFDHCGQHAALDAPVYVQADEHAVAQQPQYTVAEWADIPAGRLRLVVGEHEVADGVRTIATPGHTPGHQSVVVETDAGRVVLGGQCAFRAGELRSGIPAKTNLHDAAWAGAARNSLAKVRGLAPVAVHLSHDPEVVRFR
jgi:N-acyl homoserine lactone hydrolase